MKSYFLKIDGKVSGPYSSTDVLDGVKAKRFPFSAEVSERREGPWIAVSKAIRSGSDGLVRPVVSQQSRPPTPNPPDSDFLPSSTAEGWYVDFRGKPLGPFIVSRIREMVAQGKLTAESRVRSGRTGTWRNLGEVDGLLFPVKPDPAASSGNLSQSGGVDPWFSALNDAITSAHSTPRYAPLASTAHSSSPGFADDPAASPKIHGAQARTAAAMLEKAEREIIDKERRDALENEDRRSFRWIFSGILAAIIPILCFLVYQASARVSQLVLDPPGETSPQEKGRATAATRGTNHSPNPRPAANEGNSANSSGGSTKPSGFWGAVAGSQVKRVQLGAGTAVFTINRSGPHHLQMNFNSGLVANADWKENPFNDFGYDIYEPTVSETTNRLALMIMLRGIIASYLKGEYN
jgi:hypothetical protein